MSRDADLSDGAARMAALLDAAWPRARGEVLADAVAVAAALEAACAGDLDEMHREQAEHAAHRVAGKAGTFGFPEATAVARDLEELLGQVPDQDAAEAALPRARDLQVMLDRPQRPA